MSTRPIVLTRIQDRLARLYITREQVLQVIQEAGLDVSWLGLDPDSPPRDMWFTAINGLHDRSSVIKLLERVCEVYRGSETETAFRGFISEYERERASTSSAGASSATALFTSVGRSTTAPDDQSASAIGGTLKDAFQRVTKPSTMGQPSTQRPWGHDDPAAQDRTARARQPMRRSFTQSTVDGARMELFQKWNMQETGASLAVDALAMVTDYLTRLRQAGPDAATAAKEELGLITEKVLASVTLTSPAERQGWSSVFQTLNMVYREIGEVVGYPDGITYEMAAVFWAMEQEAAARSATSTRVAGQANVRQDAAEAFTTGRMGDGRRFN